jgi:hypothetical protein
VCTALLKVEVVFLDLNDQGDKRYIMFDHVPDQRERWLRVRGWVTVVNEPEKLTKISGLLVAIVFAEDVCARGRARWWC